MKLQQLKERKYELENELSTYKWWGNEDDIDYKEEYGDEYEHLQNELNGINEQIYKFKNTPMKSFKVTTNKIVKIQSIQSYIKHQIWLAIQKKCEMREKYENGEYETDSKYWSGVNIQNGIILGLKSLGTDLGRVYNGIEVEYQQPTKVYEKYKPLEINELDNGDTQPIENQSVTN